MGGGLKEIARLAGVAASSVSRALAGKPGVSEEKRDEILALASRLGYRPNSEARALRTGRVNDLLIVMDAQPTEIASYRNYALMALGKGSFDRVRVSVRAGGEPIDALLAQAAREGARAIIVSGIDGRLSAETDALLAGSGSAVVLVDSLLRGAAKRARYDSVEIDRETGAGEAARLLLRSGGEALRFFMKIARGRGQRGADPRMRGIERAFAEAGRALARECLVAVEGDDFAEGYEVMREVLARGPADRLFCYNDKLAVGALRAIAEAGLSVPDEVMVVGFDDLSFASYLTPPLTTVAQPVLPCAEAAIDCALSRCEDPGRPPQHRVFCTELVVRRTAFAWDERAPDARSKRAAGRRHKTAGDIMRTQVEVQVHGRKA